MRSIGMAVAMCGLATASIGHAQWFRVTTSSHGSVYSVDPERVGTVSGRRQVWLKGDHGSNRTEKARPSMTLLSGDCAAST